MNHKYAENLRLNSRHQMPFMSNKGIHIWSAFAFGCCQN